MLPPSQEPNPCFGLDFRPSFGSLPQSLHFSSNAYRGLGKTLITGVSVYSHSVQLKRPNESFSQNSVHVTNENTYVRVVQLDLITENKLRGHIHTRTESSAIHFVSNYVVNSITRHIVGLISFHPYELRVRICSASLCWSLFNNSGLIFTLFL